MPDAPGWTYAYSDALSLRYAYRDAPQGPERALHERAVRVACDATPQPPWSFGRR